MPATIEATSLFSRPLQLLAQLIANSANFRTIVGATNATDALNYIHFPMVNEDSNLGDVPTKPWAIITDDGDRFELPADSVAHGELVLTFEFPIPEEYLTNRADAEIDFRNKVGHIIADLIELNNNGSVPDETYLRWTYIKGDTPPGWCDKDRFPDEDFYGVAFIIGY